MMFLKETAVPGPWSECPGGEMQRADLVFPSIPSGVGHGGAIGRIPMAFDADAVAGASSLNFDGRGGETWWVKALTVARP